jgi:hypothetical protein
MKLSPAELTYDVVDKELLAIAFCRKKWRYFLQGAGHKNIVNSDHHNLTYIKTTVLLNSQLV